MTTPENRWLAQTGGTRGPSYAERIAQRAATGAPMHGEADFLASRVSLPANIIDAGCGTGRVAVELSDRGYHTIGVDLDGSMIQEAKKAAPQCIWHHSDILTWNPNEPVDAVMACGNVMVYLSEGTEALVVQQFTSWLAPGGHLIVGFDSTRHLSCDQYRVLAAEAGLQCVGEYSTWDADPLGVGSRYVVFHHRRAL